MPEPASFTDEDRNRLRLIAHPRMATEGGDLAQRVLAYIDHLEGALESVCNVGDRAAVQVARAALPTSKEDEEG